ncbi:MAG: hypothetical protein LBL07_12565 [Tannerella sp.]|jgi:hypothetical protein|nr:hypothetical protein [Tannerella sp.]
MKVKVIKNFVDKTTKRLKTEGSVIELTDERAKELEVSGYVKIEPKASKSKTEKPADGA